MNPYERKPARHKEGADKREVQLNDAYKFLLEHGTIEECIQTALDTRKSTRRRITGALAAVVYLIPGAREKLLLALQKHDDVSILGSNLAEFGIDPESYSFKEVKGSGHWNVVYVFEPKQPGLKSIVLKIEYPAEEHPRQEIERWMDALKDERNHLRIVFEKAKLPNLIPFTEYRIVTSPRTGKTAIAQLVEYAGDDAFDLASPKNYDRAKRLLASDTSLREDFEKYKRVAMQLRHTKEESDLSGSGNLLVVRRGDRYELVQVDPYRAHPSSKVAQGLQKRALEYLCSL